MDDVKMSMYLNLGSPQPDSACVSKDAGETIMHHPFPFKMLVDELRFGYQLSLLHCIFPNAAFTLVLPDTVTSHVRLPDGDHSSSDDGQTDSQSTNCK